jgi:isoquinoline 1-oxidoreductase beta subunit
MRAEANTRQVDQGRRQFIVSVSLAAGGLAIGIVSVKAEGRVSAFGPWSSDALEGAELSPWIEIAKDDTVTMRVPTPEVGNGAMTQVAMNVTEELACDWSRVRVEFCSIQRDYLH